MKRKETAKTVKEAYWPQVKRKPSATFRKTTAAFRRPKYLPLSYCPNCALLSNHFLTHNLLCLFIFRLSLAASLASFCLFVLTVTIAAPAVRARSSMTHRRSNCVLLLCGNRVSTSSDCSHCVLSNFSCCLQMTAKSLDFRDSIMGSLKSPCTTSYRLSIEIIALNCLVFEKIAFFYILATD